MKKYFNPLFLASSLMLLFSPLVSYAVKCAHTICLPSDYGYGGSSWFGGVNDIPTLILFIINILLSVAAIVAVLFIIIGGFRYIISAGNDEAAKGGRKTVINAVIGLVLIILSFVIISVVTNTATSASY